MAHAAFFDQIHHLIETGRTADGIHLLAGKLNGVRHSSQDWSTTVASLRAHRLHESLMRDPYVARAYRKPRGYAGDATMIDLVYTRDAPSDTTSTGKEMLATTTGIQAAEGVRLRRDYAEAQLIRAVEAEQRVLSLACGHFREGTPLIGRNLCRVTVIDQDPLSLAVVRENHGPQLEIVEANVIRFLKAAGSSGRQWDYIYTLGLTDYFDERVMGLFHQLLRASLAPGGRIVLANFVPDHLAVGWMEAVMDWHLIYRTEEDLARHARAVGLVPRTWIDATGSIAFCEMKHAKQGEG